MQSKTEEKLVEIGIPKDGKYMHPDNRIILAKVDQRGSEVSPSIEDFIVQTAPDWFQPELLVPLCDGRLAKHYISSIAVYRSRFTLQIVGRDEKQSGNSELELIPNTATSCFMLALYLARVFDCLAKIDLDWRLNPLTDQKSFSIIRQDVAENLVSLVTSTQSTKTIKLAR